jgi:hypothetical protein
MQPRHDAERINPMKVHARQLRVFYGLLLGFGMITLLSVPRAGALTQQELLVKVGSSGSGAGQLNLAGPVATDPVNGHIFVVDGGNSRVDEFTPWGNFAKAFGWDVAPAGVNEQQEVTVKATAGQFKLSFGASSTSDLEHDATAAEVEAALNALSSISSGGGAVRVEKGASDDASSRYVVSFTTGPVREADVAQVSAADGTVPLSGGAPSSSAVVRTRADGTVPETGLESCTTESGCQAGSTGTGAGQVGFGGGIAVDGNGNVYLRNASEANQRVQKFDSAGRFVLMFGGEVDKTTHANICTAASSDECGAGVPGTGPGAFEGGRGIAVGPTGRVFVADKERIEEFDAEGTYLASIPVSGKSVRELAVDPTSGAFFATFEKEADVDKLSATGAELCSFAAAQPDFIAGAADGSIYVANSLDEVGLRRYMLIQYDGGCPGTKVAEFPLSEGLNIRHEVGALATNTAGDLLIARIQREDGPYLREDFIEVYGPPPVNFEPPPEVPPTITAQYASSVDPEDATVHAEVNPHFWTDVRYYVEYGTGKCSEGGCEQVQPLPPGALLTAKVTANPIAGPGVLLQGLQPGTTYHYRFAAASGGGGPVRGVGGEVGLDGSESTLLTPARPDSPEAGCANAGFRIGASSRLPDCRAYEMVSPVDKNNGDIFDLHNISEYQVGLRQSAPGGDSIAYSSYRAFGDAVGATTSAQYLAARGPGGWSSQSLSPPRSRKGVFGEGGATDGEFWAFSSDLCSSWLVSPDPVPLAPGGIENFPNLYRRQNCPESYEALTTAQLAGAAPSGAGEAPELQGFSADGSKSVFQLPAKVTGKGTENPSQAYEASGGQVSLLCILPDEAPLGGGCSAGTAPARNFRENRQSSVWHAVSADGSRVYWTAAASGPGKIYLRLDGTSTVPVSATATSKAAQFLGASADGSKALFTVADPSTALNENLYEYDLATEESTLIAGEVPGIAGASEDLSHLYFVSREAIGGAGASGAANLYLHHEGTNTFIATLAGTDVETNEEGHFSDIAREPVYRVARATPDGRHLLFMSFNRLTGFDNTDVGSGHAAMEVFEYSTATNAVDCISCNPAGARPTGRVVKAPNGAEMWLAALVPAGENQLYVPRAQSEDGNRIFFNSYDGLVAGDTNGRADVYEWERPGSGGCGESSAAYSPSNGGCISLISSGTSPVDSEFVDSSADGRDAFLTTDASLLPQDPGLIDLYDARAGGGFPPPTSQPAACEGEACQGPYSPPNDPTPASATFHGAGNVKEGVSSRCAKGKARRKGRCVAKKKRRHAKEQKHAKSNRRSHR